MPPPPRFDLQSHSRHSDGALSPAEVVHAAAAAGVELLALTDHDTVAGVTEAVAVGDEHGVRVIAAAEISALHGGHEDLHVLGYCLDPADDALLQALERYRADREARGEQMTAALREVGFAVAREVLDAQTTRGHSLGRPHLARAVFEHPGNASRLAAEGLATPEGVLQAYLLPGRPAYRGRTIPTVVEAIEVIHAAGGVAVWAHPFWDIDDPRQTLETLHAFAADGLDGVEAFYVTHDAAQTRLLHGAAEELGLLTTGSSDFHGPEHRIFSRFLAHELHGLEPQLGPLVSE